MDRWKISEWEMILSAIDKGNIPRLMHDTRLCQIYIKIDNKHHGTSKC